MDLNIRLIDAVRQCPLLYKSNVSLADRKYGWRQVAQQMRMQEVMLKTRWHFLREHFLRNTATRNENVGNGQFPYKKEMEFLLPYVRQPQNEHPEHEEFLPVNIIKPEFVITEKDLDNDSGNEEYVFLEVEALGSEEETNVVQSTSDCEQQQIEETNDNHNESLLIELKTENTQDNELTHSGESEKCVDINIEATCNKTTPKEDEIVKAEIKEAALENVTKIESNTNISNSAASNQGSNNNTDERCEDAIFGELVTAMLKRMQAEKKREVKRHIMNLLLT